ncbi:HAD family hydrolase [Dictyobacter kobayashii]|uniref:Haloacid dehalogenase n=1 Tax=Dictyobacter kobayashii TaxID=2014872 RepID=A0A402AWI4_9CHLR|nr:haloacid dehalogenase-like hydrolase [Dictyobacter kobayashii]GCE23466.1 haloacid dehalogenase [Dictyobacter kobayashii]
MTDHAYNINIDTDTSTHAEPLASWQDGPTKRAILKFVQQVTDKSSSTYVPVAERIAAFDNDGTLWCEKPSYTQEIFIIKYFHEQAERHPELREVQPFKAFLENDRAYFQALSIQEVGKLVLQAVADLPQEEYVQKVRTFFEETLHPHYQRPFTEMAYAPMMELIGYLRQHEFQVYLVTGGETDFVREIAEKMYGIPRSHVIGSAVMVKLETYHDQPMLVRQKSMLEPFNEGTGKVVNIHVHIGQQPILAVGNSNGDLDMLLYTEHQSRPHLPLLIHHDDSEREFAYERGAERALQAATLHDWNIISMKNDFKHIFSFAQIDATYSVHQ